MLKKILLLIPKSDLSLIRRNYADQARFFRKPLSPQVQQEATNAGMDTNHPVIVDPAKPDPTGKLSVKGQGTHGPGDPANPSHILDSKEDFKGDKKQQKVVIPKKSFFVDKKHLGPPIKTSESQLDKQEVKDNFKKAGAQPSDYKSGDKYE